MAEKLEFDLLVKQNDLSKSLKDAANQAQAASGKISGSVKPLSDLNNQIEKTSTLTSKASDFMSQFGVQTLGVAAGQFAFAAVSSAINFLTTSLTESIAAYSESEDAINKLNQSLNLTGSYSESASEGVQQFAAEMQATSKYGDEAVLSQFNFAKSLGLTTEQAKQLTTASINLSAQLGFSLEESTSKLAKTLSGDLPRGLKNLIPELKTLTQEQLRNGEAADIINKKYSGSAANELKTYSGQIASLKNSYNDLQERVGENIVKSGIWQGAMDRLKKTIDEVNNSSKAEKTLLDNTNGSAAASSRTREQLANDYVGLTKRIEELNQRYGDLAEEERRTGQMSLTESSMSVQMKIKEIQTTRDLIDEKLRLQKTSTPKEAAEGGANLGLTAEQEQALNKTKNTTIKIQEEIIAEKKRIRDEETISIITEEEGKREAQIASILEFETRKAEIDAELKEKELSVKLTRQEKEAEILKIGKEKELAILQASGKAESALSEESDKKQKAGKQAALAFEVQNLKTRGEYIAAFGNLGAALAADGSKAQFIIQKAAAIASSIVATQLGVAQALALGPILGPPLAANMQLIGNINTAAIAATAIKGFEQGGFVGGMAGASLGADNRVAKVRDGEMILNASQQKNLLDIINSGGGSGGDVVIQVDGIEIARAVRTQMNKGFRLA